MDEDQTFLHLIYGGDYIRHPKLMMNFPSDVKDSIIKELHKNIPSSKFFIDPIGGGIRALYKNPDLGSVSVDKELLTNIINKILLSYHING